MDISQLLEMLKQDPGLIQQVAGGGGGNAPPPPLDVRPPAAQADAANAGAIAAAAPAAAPGTVPPPPSPAPPPAPPPAPGTPGPGQGGSTAAPGSGGPPDMASLYTKLIDQATKKQQMDDFWKGPTLIAAGFARPESRQSLIQMAGASGGSGTSGLSGISGSLEAVRKMQEDAQKAQIRKQQQARLPALAKEYGLDMQTVEYLFETGKLDELINESAKPNREVVTNADGSRILIDKNKKTKVMDITPPDATKDLYTQVDPETGETWELKKGDPTYKRVIAKKDPAKDLYTHTDPESGEVWELKRGDPDYKRVVSKGDPSRNMEIFTDTNGDVYERRKGQVGKGTLLTKGDPTKRLKTEKTWDGAIVQYDPADPDGTMKIVREGDARHGWTGDQKELDVINAERYQAGQKPKTMEEHLADKAKSTRQDPVGEAFGKTLVDDYKIARTSRQTVQQTSSALDILDRPGGTVSGSMAAPPELEARKVLAHAFGYTDKAADNTEAFKAQIKELVLPRVKQLGSGSSISNADRDYIDKALGGSAELTPQVAREILIRVERLELDTAMDYNRRVATYKRNNPGAQVMEVELPKLSPQALPPDAIEWMRRNPGKTAEFDSKFKIPGLGRAILEGRYGGQ